jgi:tRNA(Ile)-lysidine synthase
MPQADAWQAQLEARCDRWRRRGAALRLACHRVTDRPGRGDSVEAWAREQRYRALAQMALDAGCRNVLLGHHRRDQAETFLLQALRGAGVAGLAAMPVAAQRSGVVWIRPWLDQPREAIEAHLVRHRLRFVDDPSNADPRHARNRLRLQVWPALCDAFPQAERVLADAAQWARQAAEGLRELALLDLGQVGDADALRLDHAAGLSPVRRTNVLRAWLQIRTGRPPPASLVERLAVELWPAPAGPGPTAGGAARHWPCGEQVLRAWRGRLTLVPAAACSPAAAVLCPAPAPTDLGIRRAGRHPLPAWGGALMVRRVREGGVPLAMLAAAEVRARAGGERFQSSLDRPARSLKKQFQAADLPAWQRDGPLLFSGGRLVFVPGLGLDARAIGLPGQALVSLDWIPG